MAVSQAGVTWYFRGDVDGCKQAVPYCMEMLRLNRNINDLGEVKVWSKTFNLPGGGVATIRAFDGYSIMMVDVPPEGGLYAEDTDEYRKFIFMYDPVVCFNPDTGTEIECSYDNKCYGPGKNAEKCSVERIFERKEVVKNSSYTEIPYKIIDVEGNASYPFRAVDGRKALNVLCPAGDASWHHCYRAWSKTVDEYTATCVLFYDQWIGSNMWAIILDKNGEHLPFKAGKLTYDWWPYTGVVDSVQVGGVDPLNVTPVFKAFDLWKESVLVNGKSVMRYYLSVLADPAQHIDVWCLNYSEITMKLETIGISWINDYVEENHLYFPYVSDDWEIRHIRVIGLVKRTGYWAMIDCDYGAPTGASDPYHVYWENDTQSGITTVPDPFQFAILDEYDESIMYLPRIFHQECEEIDGSVIFDPGYYKYAVNCYTWDCASDASDCSDEGVIGQVEGNGCTLTHNGVQYNMPAFSGIAYCENYPECGWSGPYGDPGSVMICAGITPMGGPPILGSFAKILSYFETVDDGTDCIQDGLEAGSSITRQGGGQNYVCSNGMASATYNASSSCGWAWRCHCNGACDPCGRCSSGYTGNNVNGGCWRENDDNYIVTTPTIIEAAILHNQILGKYTATSRSGELAVCDGVIQVNTIEDTVFVRDFPDGAAGDFAQGQWPYYPPYAIVKEGYACEEAISSSRYIKQKIDSSVIEGYEFEPDDKEDVCHITTGTMYAYRDNNLKIYSNSGSVIGESTFFFYESDIRTARSTYDVN